MWTLSLLAFATLPAMAGLIDPATGKAKTLDAGAPATHLVFFATWCPDCVEELESLTELEARWAGQGYRVVLIAVKNRHTAERLNEFVQGRDLGLELLWDEDGAVARRHKASALPTHVLLDRDGKELARSSRLDETIREKIASTVDRRRRSRGRK